MLGPDDFASTDDDQLVERLLANWTRLNAPLAWVGDPQTRAEPIPTERREPDGPERPSMWRWPVIFTIDGDTELLTRWPDGFGAEPASSDEYFLPIPSVYWTMTGRGAIAFFDVRRADDPDGIQPPTDRILEATAYLEAAIHAVNTQVAEYERELGAELLEAVRRRRERLGTIADRQSEVVALVRERFGPLELEEPVAVADAPVVADEAGDINLNFAVTTGTFRDLLWATRKWRTGVERYGDDFSQLGEETITSLLVTALNLPFDTAQREVFHAKGKTDILVQADVGKPTEAAYIGEAKIWGGQAEVCADLAQVVGYAIARTRDLMLLYYVRPANLDLVVRRAHEALERCDLFVGWEEDDDGDRVAVVRHRRFDCQIRVSVLFVHVPTEGAQDPDDS